MQGLGNFLQDVDDGDQVVTFTLDFGKPGAEPGEFVGIAGWDVSWPAEALLRRSRRRRPRPALVVHSPKCAR